MSMGCRGRWVATLAALASTFALSSTAGAQAVISVNLGVNLTISAPDIEGVLNGQNQ
ncbi:MAG: hypothetical protein QOI73_1538, partial [Solirubrobacteraceae bacterium]|nr:hypothetical protein [Solirubrobacteraceae bacterium]